MRVAACSLRNPQENPRKGQDRDFSLTSYNATRTFKRKPTKTKTPAITFRPRPSRQFYERMSVEKKMKKKAGLTGSFFRFRVRVGGVGAHQTGQGVGRFSLVSQRIIGGFRFFFGIDLAVTQDFLFKCAVRFHWNKKATVRGSYMQLKQKR